MTSEKKEVSLDYEDITEERLEDLGFPGILRRQIDRVGKCSIIPEKYRKERGELVKPPTIEAIKFLAVLISPYLKKDYVNIHYSPKRDGHLDRLYEKYGSEVTESDYWYGIMEDIMRILENKNMLFKIYRTDVINASDEKAINFIPKFCYNKMLKEDENALVYCGGQTGSGKSYAQLAIMEAIYELQGKEVPKENIVFTVSDFLRRVNATDEDGDYVLQPGDVMLFDEAGVSADNQKWYTLINQALNAVAQTFRERNLTVLFTAPILGFIDKKVRQLFHVYFEMTEKYMSIKQSEAKVHLITTNPKTGNMYYKYPVLRKEGRNFKLKRVRFNLPNKELRSYYDKIEKEFKRRLSKRKEQEIIHQAEEELKKKMKKSEDKIIEKIIENKNDYKHTYQDRVFLDRDLIQHDFSVGTTISKRVQKVAERKIKKQDPTFLMTKEKKKEYLEKNEDAKRKALQASEENNSSEDKS